MEEKVKKYFKGQMKIIFKISDWSCPLSQDKR